MNNVTWMDETAKKPHIVGAMPVVTVPYPGFYSHFYPTLNQTEPWIVISMPHPDYLFMLWCGENPVMKYAGGIVMSPNKDYHNMPEWVDQLFREAAAKHDVDYDKDMFFDDNSKCSDHP